MGEILSSTDKDADLFSTYDAAHYLDNNGNDIGTW